MENVSLVGIDLSKNIFHLHGVNHMGRKVFQKKVGRELFLKEIAKLPKGCTVAMEACGASHYWAREIHKLGYSERQISPQFVKAFLKSQKNDFNDAEATSEAAARPSMRFVSTKSEEQQDIQALHRIRTRLVAERTALINQIRGLLAERGVVFNLGSAAVRRNLAILLESPSDKISVQFAEVLKEMQSELQDLDKKLKGMEKKLLEVAQKCPTVQRLQTIPGIGVLTATALLVVSGDPHSFKNGREFSAWLGLVPRQITTGGKPRLLGITKRGDVYVRTLLIHGARIAIRHALKKSDKLSLWVQKLQKNKGTNLAAVALANKNARIAWRLLTSNEVFDPSLPFAD